MLKLKLCDFIFDIRIKYKYTLDFLSDYIVKTDDEAAFTVEVTEEELKSAYEKDPSFPLPYHETLCLYRNICSVIPSCDAFMMHASVVVHEGVAYVFTAKSGTGKTTHSMLWLKNFPGSFIINGDKPIFRLIDGEFYVYGTPWCGKEGYNKNTRAKVGSLCFIQRGKENLIRPMSSKEVLLKIFDQLFLPQDKEMTESTFSLLDKFLRAVPAYVLSCTISDEAAVLAEKTMNARG
ncbi:MAG: hypothetical protein IJD97_00180 [Clostridia bacterium]|nr:hypothetical protein [Clostridia bacterium]